MTNMIPEYVPYVFSYPGELFAHWVRTQLVAISSRSKRKVIMAKLTGFHLKNRSKFDAKIVVHRLPYGDSVSLLVWIGESKPPEVEEKVLWIQDVSEPGVIVN